MGHVVFAMHTSLDGYVSGASGGPEDFPMPGEELHQHFNDLERNTSLSLYGRKMYGDMRYWDTDDPAWEPVHRD